MIFIMFLKNMRAKKWCETTWSSNAWCSCLLMSKVSHLRTNLVLAFLLDHPNPMGMLWKWMPQVGRQLGYCVTSIGKTSVQFLYKCWTWTSNSKDWVTGFQILLNLDKIWSKNHFACQNGHFFTINVGKRKTVTGSDLPLQLRTCCTFGNELN